MKNKTPLSTLNAQYQPNDQLPLIKLNWVQTEWGFEVRVPAMDANNVYGYILISAIQRPYYCDRGKWHTMMETNGVYGLDSQEEVFRYFFKIENLKDEMESWVNNRASCLDARKYYLSKQKTKHVTETVN